MDELRIPENCAGLIKFKDGRTEPIIEVGWRTNQCFDFRTKDAIYRYRETYEFPEVKYFDNTKYVTAKHVVYWYKAEGFDWKQVYDIESVLVIRS